MKVYTKKGDKGTTSLDCNDFSGFLKLPEGRFDCSAGQAGFPPRLEAYGTVDELMSFTAYLRDNLDDTPRLSPYRDDLLAVLDHLMRAASHLATEGEAPKYLPEFGPEKALFLENRIDAMQSTLPAIAKFTLPGGHPAVSLCHICRTICRRTERIVLTLSEQYTVNEYIRQYINRLSDYFYVLGRRLTEDFNVKEILWVYDK